jgi:hypothetical protein
MFARPFSLVLALLGVVYGSKIRELYGQKPVPLNPNDPSPGDPLFLTPLIEQGQIDLAKNLSRVGPIKGTNLPSYSGYFTVNKTIQSNLFFWFFPALVRNNIKT